MCGLISQLPILFHCCLLISLAIAVSRSVILERIIVSFSTIQLYQRLTLSLLSLYKFLYLVNNHTTTFIFHHAFLAICLYYTESYGNLTRQNFCFHLMLSYEEIDFQREAKKYYSNQNSQEVKKGSDGFCFATTVFMDESFEVSFCWTRNVFTKTFISSQINVIILTWVLNEL